VAGKDQAAVVLQHDLRVGWPSTDPRLVRHRTTRHVSDKDVDYRFPEPVQLQPTHDPLRLRKPQATAECALRLVASVSSPPFVRIDGDADTLTSLTNFNVAISVISLFVLLTKMIGTIMKVYRPVIGLFVSITLTALYATSVYGQMGPDYADPRYPSPIAWYISKSCDYAKPFGAESSCKLAKGTFAATVYML